MVSFIIKTEMELAPVIITQAVSLNEKVILRNDFLKNHKEI
jgi:hypothetical protein